MSLPKSLTVDFLSSKAVPGDMTIGETLAYIREADWFKALQTHCPRARVHVIDEDGDPVNEAAKMSRLRERVAAGKWHISIDDGEGGMRVSA